MDDAAEPPARLDEKEDVALAFIAAIQLLPPRQRAVLLLRDVLAWSVLEVADSIDSSVASVNKALQRARSTLRARFEPAKPGTNVVSLSDLPEKRLLARSWMPGSAATSMPWRRSSGWLLDPILGQLQDELPLHQHQVLRAPWHRPVRASWFGTMRWVATFLYVSPTAV